MKYQLFSGALFRLLRRLAAAAVTQFYTPVATEIEIQMIKSKA